MEAFDVVHQETRRMARGFLPLALLTYAGFALAGYYDWTVAVGVLLGTGYALFHFYLMACSAVQAALIGDPVRARKMQISRYLMRYVLTGALLVGLIRLTPLHPVAAVLPLFYPKVLLTVSGIFQKKGG